MTDPSKAAAVLQQGLFHHRQGQLQQAMERYVEVLQDDPENADALYYIAVVACQEEQFKQGIELGRRALDVGPPQARVHNLIGKAHERLGEAQEALNAFDAAIALDGNFAEAHGNRAGLLATAGHAAEALAGFDRALALDPSATADWINRGALLKEMGSYVEALASYERALKLMPDNPDILISRADLLTTLGRLPEAEAAYAETLKRDPKRAVAYAHQATVVRNQGRLVEARQLAERGLAITPDEPASSFVLAQLMLLNGEWPQAWPLFERREALPRPPFQPLDAPRWQGEPPADFRLVLMAEQGLGDTIQFSRYASTLAERGYPVTLLAPPVLAPLLRTLPGVEHVVSSLDEMPDDGRPWRWLPLMSVMGALNLTPETVPAPGVYLRAEAARIAKWAERIGDRGFKVGIVWRGTTNASAAPLSALAPLAEIAGARLISLQKGPGADEIPHVPFAGRIEQPIEPHDLSPDALLDTAAIMTNLDLVVSIDSMPAHLAGALARPVFLALPQVPDWRWLLNRADTSWYPATRLFRQDETRQWQPVFAAIAQAVREKMAPASSPR